MTTSTKFCVLAYGIDDTEITGPFELTTAVEKAREAVIGGSFRSTHAGIFPIQLTMIEEYTPPAITPPRNAELDDDIPF